LYTIVKGDVLILSIYLTDRSVFVTATPMASSPGYPRKRARTRRQLLVAGMAELAVHGPDGAAVGQIAHSAHVSTGTFYNHFDSLGALVGAVVDDLAGGIERARDLLLRVEQDPAVRVAMGARQLLDLARTDPPTANGFVNLFATVPSFHGRVHAVACSTITDGIVTGRFVHRPAEITTDAVIGVVTQGMRSRLSGAIDLDVDLDSVRLSLILEITGLSRTDAGQVIERLPPTETALGYNHSLRRKTAYNPAERVTTRPEAAHTPQV
jgi:AcrR family transcriptional regulator